MATSTAFHRQIAMHHPSIEPLLLALAGCYGPVDAGAANLHVARMAARLDDVPGEPEAQLAALAARIGPSFATPSARHMDGTLDDLLAHRALSTGEADELLAAALIVAIAQRHGWSVGVVAAGSQAFVSHRDLERPLLLRPGGERTLIDARDVEHAEHLSWRCPHEVADGLLTRLARRAEELCLPHHALTTAELALLLPMGTRAQSARTVRLQRVRARFN